MWSDGVCVWYVHVVLLCCLLWLYIQHRLAEMQKSYEYQGVETCAADGMCQEKCPVKVRPLTHTHTHLLCV